MHRQRSLWLTIGLLVLTALACNAFAGNLEPTLAPLPTLDAEATAVVTTSITPAPTATLPGTEATIEGTPVGNAQVTLLVDLNVRNGPGVQYDRIGFLLQDTMAPIIGVDAESGWWKIDCPLDIEGDECWISGGQQYVRASDATDVPIAVAPPTPTPVPPELGPEEGILAYIDNGRLFAARLDLTQNPPLASEPRQLTEDRNVQALFIAPDGRRVAYLTGTAQRNSLNIVNSDGRDQRRLIDSAELLLESQDGLTPLIAQVQWLPGGSQLLFNTDLANATGPGVGSREDLWLTTLDSEVTELLETGSGGGAFTLGDSDAVLLSRRDAIARATLTTETTPQIDAPQVVISFAPINTASEYIYYPQPQWTDTGRANVAIPDADPWAPGAGATLWQIGRSGPATPTGQVTGNILFHPVLWSNRAGRLAHVQTIPDQEDALIVAQANGTEVTPYDTGEQVTLWGWSPGDDFFLYSSTSFYAIGQVDGPPLRVPLSPGQRVANAAWLAPDVFIVALGFPESNAWSLNSVTADGLSAPLLTFSSGANVAFDAWAP